jgi:hypothetical protein
MSNLRTFRLNATTSYDGATVIGSAYTPQTNAKQPLMSITQAAIGRISFKELCRPGNIAGLCRVRSWGVSGIVATLCSVSASEVAELPAPDDPDPIGVDRALQAISVTSEWSAPFQAGPSDALTLEGPRGTVEIQWMDMSGSELLTFWNAVASAPAALPIQVLEVVADTELTAWSGLLYVLFEPATDGVEITLPEVGDMSGQATLVVAKTAGLWGTLAPNGTDELNGGSDALILDEQRATIVSFVADQWVATDAAPATIGAVFNDGVGGSQLLPVINGTRAFSVIYEADGTLELPAIDEVALGAKYILQRAGDNASSPSVPARCKVIVEDASDKLNGVADDFADLSPNGATLVIERVEGGWFVTDNGGSQPRPVTVTAGNFTFGSGWQGTRYARNTSAGAMTYTLPPAAKTPIGCRLVAVDEGAGGMTLSADANIIAAGVSAATLTGAQLVPRVVEFNGTNWIST